MKLQYSKKQKKNYFKKFIEELDFAELSKQAKTSEDVDITRRLTK